MHGKKFFGIDYLSAKISSTGQKDMTEPKWPNKYDHNTATLLNCSLNFEITFSVYTDFSIVLICL